MPETVLAAEETLIIETPERVELEFSLASIGNRFMAVGIDHFIQFLSIFLIAWIFAWVASADNAEGLFEDSPKWVTAIMILVVFALFASYFAVFEWLWNGQTPGKRLMKLRVVREDGRPLTLWEAIVRNLLRIADAAPGFIVPIYSVGLITIFLNRRDQRLGDIFAGTVVIRERIDQAPTFADTFSKRIADPALTRVQKPVTFTADISKITEDEIEVVEIFLRRRWDLSERQRLWMAWRIALPLMYKLKPRYSETDFSYEGFLEELLARFEARQRFAN
ncbi:MAG: RDD family protein [Acidobacteria bacterium]|nr:RDD family protein [Acidobacteriota bacterium]